MYKVQESTIHGHGLFSTTLIQENTILGFCQIRPAKKKQSPYVLWCEAGPVEVVCDLKYINHSATPNVAYYDDFSVVALTTIQAGEELTHNYEQ